MSKCSRFCRRIYLPAAKRLSDQDRYSFPYYSLSGDKKWAYNTCMQGFCNPTCKGYQRSRKKEKEWRKSRKNGFHTSYTASQIKRYQKEGALSGCIESHNIY